MPVPARPSRSNALDLLRAAAILLVLGCHNVMAPAAAGALSPLGTLWHQVGWAGVDLFFVLSGFLVTGLLFDEYRTRGRIDLRRFLVRRGFKIWPAYFVYLAIVGAWLAIKRERGEGGSWAELWPNLLHVQNYFGTPRIHTWSLAVEEHFYLVGGLLAALCLTSARELVVRRFFPLAGALALVVLAALRFQEYTAWGPEQMNLFATHLRFDGLLCGAVLAYWDRFSPARLSAWQAQPGCCLVAGLVLAAPTLMLTPEYSAWMAGPGLSLMYIGFGFVLLAARGWEEQRSALRPRAGLIATALQRIGIASYGIYLWHIDLAQVPVKKAVAMLLSRGVPGEIVWVVTTAAYVLLAYLVGTIVMRVIELPMLALRDSLFPSRTAGVELAHPPAAAKPASVPPIPLGPASVPATS